MTKLIIDLSDVAGGTHPDDKVVVWSPVHREGSAGRTVAPTPYTIPLTDGRGESEVEPGPLMVQTHVRAIADTRPKEVVVPDQDTVTLWELLEQVFQWTPPLVNRALQAIIDTLEDALAQVDGAVDSAVADIKWYRGGLNSTNNLDTHVGSDYQGLYRVTAGVGGGTGMPGWVEITYDDNSARTRQVFTPSSPADTASLDRKYSGGSWGGWTPVTWSGVVVTSGSADDLLNPHVYGINSTSVAGLPAAVLGSLETLPAGSGLSTLSQRFTSSEAAPRTWVRARRSGSWSGWVRLTTEQDVEEIVTRLLGELDISGGTLSMDARETPSTGGSVIVQSMSDDGVVGYNALSPTVRQSWDKGATWEDVETFAGNNVEWVRALPSGELMVETTGWVDGEAGVRRIWVSTGYDRHSPGAASWAVTLTAAAPLVKFADWSISITEDMLLLAEYGPKAGVAWGSTPSIPEGENARYIYQSTDGGYTWSTIFDLNDFLLSNGRTSANGQHLHGVAWDKWWQRIWVTFGDATNDGSNGVLYSDDQGGTWEVAYWTHTHTGLGWQVVGIQPMQDCVLFAGDMTPSGLIALDRSEGRDAFNFYTAWDFSETDKHLCHVIRYASGPLGEIAMFAFAREGSASPSFIVGTRDGREFVVLWQEEGTSLPGIRSLAGPSADGTVIAAHNTSSGWVEVSGRLHVTGSPWQADTKADLSTLDTRIPKTLALRRDTTVGTRIMAGDTMIYGDTGWRDITTQSNVATGGNIFIRRHGDNVLLVFYDVQLSSRGDWQNLVQIPSGFRTAIRIDHRPEVFTDVTTLIMNYEVGQYRSTGHASSDDPMSFRDTWMTSDPWPATLPGTPA